MTVDQLSSTFQALGDPTRRAILARLTDGEATVSELAEPFPMSLQAVSKHLKVLERAGLITRTRSAQWRPCRLDASPLEDATDWLERYRRFWEGNFDRLQAHLHTMKKGRSDMNNAERGYTITRTFDAPRDLVWEAWTKPEHFAVWFGTDAVEMHDVELDVRPEGRWHGTMVYEGREIGWYGIYREVIEPERLVVDFSDGTGGPDDYDTFTVTLVAVGEDRTEMTVRQSGGHLSDEEYEQAKIGTNSFFDTMEALLARELKARHETA